MRVSALAVTGVGSIPLQILQLERRKFIIADGQVGRKYALRELVDEESPTHWSLLDGAYCICWAAVTILTGMSYGTLQSVAQTPGAL